MKIKSKLDADMRKGLEPFFAGCPGTIQHEMRFTIGNGLQVQPDMVYFHPKNYITAIELKSASDSLTRAMKQCLLSLSIARNVILILDSKWWKRNKLRPYLRIPNLHIYSAHNINELGLRNSLASNSNGILQAPHAILTSCTKAALLKAFKKDYKLKSSMSKAIIVRTVAKHVLMEDAEAVLYECLKEKRE